MALKAQKATAFTPADGTVLFRARPGKKLGVFYRGAYVYITEQAPVGFEMSEIPYSALAEIRLAIAAGSIEQVQEN